MDGERSGKGVIRLKTRDAAVESSVHYFDEVAREGKRVKRISGDVAGELGRLVKFLKTRAAQGIKWRGAALRSP